MSEQEAREEAERRYPGRYGSQSLFVKGAEWQASRKVEAAPSDTEKLIRHTRNIARYEGITDGQASVLRATADALERLSQPVQVEVTDEMVERAAEAAWGWLIPAGFDVEPWDEAGDADCEASRVQLRAALEAALGGDHE